MSEHTYLSIDGHVIYDCHEAFDPLVMSLFTLNEKVLGETTYADYDPAFYREYPKEGAEPLATVHFVADSACLRDRLDVKSFSYSYVEAEFGRGRDRELARLEDSRGALGITMDDYLDEQTRRVSELTLEAWTGAFRRFLAEGFPSAPRRLGERTDLPDLDYYMLTEGASRFFGFPTDDSRVFLRAALQCVDSTVLVTVDVTDNLAQGRYDTVEDMDDELRALATFGVVDRTIVLTEGSSDKRIIEGALALLRPHLREHFSFLDFDELRVPGGAGSVVSFVKAFAAAGILNRIIAILDNDTAARDAVRSLRGLNMPDSIRVIHLPNAEWLLCYPTLGPTGRAEADVNGLAASIELFLGKDVLIGSDGVLRPVQWKGYNEALRQYQGEVVDKAILHAAFAEKLVAATASPDSLAVGDWNGLNAVIDQLCAAFDGVLPSDHDLMYE